MPPKELRVIGKLYINGKELINVTELETIKPMTKPIGDLHSVPHYRCGVCNKAVVLYEDDDKPDKCPWCGEAIDWR